MKTGRSPLRTYEGQIKIVLVLLVLFLAVAIYCNVHLLMMARNAIQDEVGRRLAIQADLVRTQLERDQMLRGLRARPDEMPYIPPTFLDRIARLEGMISIEILATDGTVISSSDPERVGGEDTFLTREGGGPRGTLMSGGSVVTPLDRAGGSTYATLAAYRPIRDRRHQAIAFIRIEETVPALASVDRSLKLIASLQAGGLVFILVLVIFFARWLLQPYRRLLSAAGETPGTLAGLGTGPPGEAGDELVRAFQGVLDKLGNQERELRTLEPGPTGAAGAQAFPGENLIGGMTSAVLAFDTGGRLAVMNTAAETLLGLRRDDAVGARYQELLEGNERLVDLIGRGLRSGESYSREVLPMRNPSGKLTHLGVMVSPIRPPGDRSGEGRAEGILCLLADLTEIKALRERVGLKENLASLGEMSAGIAHEFRNSLATIQGLARLIAKSGNGSRNAARDNAEAILREVRTVERVVRDFIRYARPADLDLSEVDLRGLVDEVVGEFRDDPVAAGVRVETDGEFPRLTIDEGLIRQALHNLLRNAAEAVSCAGEGRGGRVIVRGLPARDEKGGVRIIVEDNGPGVAPADLPHLFTPFFTTRDRGTGLGLAMVQKAAALHDGQVEVDSEPGHGARFSIILPRRPGEQETPSVLS